VVVARSQRLAVSDREDAFAAVIRCTADLAKADKRTRSKWSRALRFAAAYKPESEPLNQFIRRKGASMRALLGLHGSGLPPEPQNREWPAAVITLPF
jgi:hypothetical protein